MPTTTEDKAISTHAAVPPPPGECPESLTRLTDEFTAQLQPGNLLERHYVEKIAAASWRLRRLHRWQAQTFEDEPLTEDERLNKLDRVLRHETYLNRQIDTAVKMLTRDVPRLFAGRAHADPTPNGQNEPAARDAAAPPGGRSFSERDSSPRPTSGDKAENCQNEPAPAASPSDSPPTVNGGRGRGVNFGPGSSRGASLTLTANGRLVPARADVARRLLDSA